MNPNYPPTGPQGPYQQPQGQQPQWQQQPQQQQPMQVPQGFQQPPQGYGPPAVYQQPAQQQWGAPAPQQQRMQPNFNVTDQDFLNMALEYDPNADANAAMPPVLPTEYVFGSKDQGYTCTAEFSGEWKPMVTSQGKKYAQVAMLLTIVDCVKNPAMNNRKLRFDAKTLVFEGSLTSMAQSIIQAAGYGQELLTRPKTVQTLMELINHIVNTKRRINNVLVDWEARFWDKDQIDPRTGKNGVALANPVKGWEKFPKDQTTGMPVPEISRTTAMGPTERNAQMVVRFASVGKPTGQPVGQPVINLAPAMQVPVSQPTTALNAPAPQWGAPAPQPQQPMQQPQQQQWQPQAPPMQQASQQQQPMQQPQQFQLPMQPMQVNQPVQQPMFQQPPAPPATYQPQQAQAVQAPPVIFGS
jgi:hypothetical protein